MATLGDLNPNLNKKSQLQLENEARAAQQAQQTAIDKQSKDYIGQGADPSKINAMQEPAPFVEPGMNLKLVQQNENAYMGPTQTMGQQTPGAFQQTDLQKQNAALANPQPQQNQTIPGESDLMRQAREHNQSMLNSGIYNGQPQPENLQQYDVNAVNAQHGYVKNYGGKVNIAPELFTGRQLPGMTQSTGTATTKAQQLDQEAQTAQSKINGQIWNEQNQGDFLAAKNARDAANAYKNSPEYQQEQAAIQQQQQALQDRSNAEFAQNTQMSNGQQGNTGVSTGSPLFDAQAQMAGQVAQDEIQMAQDTAYQKDQAARQGIINSLWQTNISDLGYQKEDLNRMSTEQLVSLANTDGLSLSKSIKDRLTAGGKAQLESEKLAQTNELADNEMTKRQIERQLGRSIQEREQFNTQQDTKLRRMLGMFGGGQVQDLAGNMAVMDAQEKGKTALEDLRADYGDRMDQLGRQYTQISQTHTSNIKQIEGGMANALEGAYADLMGKFEGYVNAGVTNKVELNKAMLTAKKDYLKNYVDITSKGAEFMQKQNEATFNQLMKLKENQRADDKAMSDLYGVSYRNGQPVLDQNGQRVPTFEMMKFGNEQDKFMTEQQGIFYKDGRPMLDSKGQTIETLGSKKFQQDANQFQQTYGLNVAKFNQDAEQFGMKYAQDQQKQAFEQMKYGNTQNLDNAKFAMEAEKNGYDVSLIGASSPSFNGNNSHYSPVATPDGNVNFQIQTGTRPQNGRDQCGEFVNDALGMKLFGNEIAQKRSVATLQTPSAGAAFVQSTQGPYGHVGLIEGIQATDAQGRPTALKFVDSNYGSNGIIQRGTMTVSYDKNGTPTYKRNGSVVHIDGFTAGILPSKQQEQQRTQGAAYGPQRPEKSITGETERFSNQYGPQMPLGSYKAEGPQPAQQPSMQFGNMLLTKKASTGVNTSAFDQIPTKYIPQVAGKANQFDAEPQVKNFQIVQNAIDTVRNTPNDTTNPSDDQNLIYAFAKMMDPNSVVREGEYATVQKYSQSMKDQFGSSVNQAVNGTGFLTKAARENIKNTLERKYKTSQKEYSNIRNQYISAINKMAGKDIGKDILQDYEYGTAQLSSTENNREQAKQLLESNGYNSDDASIDLYLSNNQ